MVAVFTKNKTGEKADEAMETLEKRRRRFYGDDASERADERCGPEAYNCKE